MRIGSIISAGMRGIVVFAVALCAASAARAAPPKLLGSFNAWAAYSYDEGGAVCFITAEPSSRKPAKAARGKVFFSVTHRPADKVRGEASVRLGYPIKPDSRPIASTDKTRFELASGRTGEDANWAWLANTERERAFVEMLKKGNTLVVAATSQRGTRTTDTYSLKGFSAAMQRIDEACKGR